MKTLALDLDGVVHSYRSGWQGAGTLPDPPNEGAFEFILDLLDSGRWSVVIHSSRFANPEEQGLLATILWFLDHGFPANQLDASELDSDGSDSDFSRLTERYPTVGTSGHGLLRFSAVKPGAFVSLDDRALTFTGRWPTLDQLEGFRTWTQREAPLDPVERLLVAVMTLKDPAGKVIGMTADDLGEFGRLLLSPHGAHYAKQLLALVA
jgi:hypothetical protein